MIRSLGEGIGLHGEMNGVVVFQIWMVRHDGDQCQSHRLRHGIAQMVTVTRLPRLSQCGLVTSLVHDVSPSARHLSLLHVKFK